MSEYVLIEYAGETSTRTTVYHTTLSALKRRETHALKNSVDKVVIVESNEINDFTWTRERTSTKWKLAMTPKRKQWFDR